MRLAAKRNKCFWAGRPQAAPTARLDRRECRLGVDAIGKVENRKPTKISRKSFFGHCCCRTVLWSQYKGRRSLV
jgi:hypothetical protein